MKKCLGQPTAANVIIDNQGVRNGRLWQSPNFSQFPATDFRSPDRRVVHASRAEIGWLFPFFAALGLSTRVGQPVSEKSTQHQKPPRPVRSAHPVPNCLPIPLCPNPTNRSPVNCFYSLFVINNVV